MTIQDHINVNVLGQPSTFKICLADVPTNDWVIFRHGKGECGPLDGSKLPLLEKHGPLEKVKNGFSYPFNIIAPQVAINHNSSSKVIAAWLKLKYNAQTIIATGLSLGGYGVYDDKLYDKLNLIYAIAPVCGAGRITQVNDYPQMKAWHFHGDADTTVKLGTAKGFIDKYNLLHPESPIKLTIYPGVGHNAWDKAYDVTPGKDELLEWFIQMFAEAPKPGSNVEAMQRLNALLHQMQNGVDTIDLGISQIRETFK